MYRQSNNSSIISKQVVLRAAPLFLGMVLNLFFTGLCAARQNTVPDSVFERSGAPETPLNAVKTKNGGDDSTAEKKQGSPVELNADNVEFSVDSDELYATGNVLVVRGGNTLTCDLLVYSKSTQMATATGHVILGLGDQGGSITGEKFVFNFQTMTGKLDGARINSSPFYGKGEYISKDGPNHLQMANGYMTTCDHDKPHFRLLSKKIDIYPGDKIAARGMRLLAGNMPLAYIPRYTQRLDRKPIFVMTPGYDKDWGAFLLTQWRYQLNPHVKTTFYVDIRERTGIAEGFGVKYDIPNYGDGVIKTYYMNELTMQRRHLWEDKLGPTTDRERFRAAWRHRWQVSNRTNAIWQYYKLSDSSLLKDYFERERDRDLSPSSFALVTHALERGTLSFDATVRVNRFESIVEKLPEIRLDLPTGKIGESGFYWRNISTYSNFSLKDPSPTEVRKETMRVDTLNEISHPFKVAFIEINPSVGGRETYYSKTKHPTQYDVIRGQFFTGASLSTKFLKVLDVQGRWMGIPIEKLRHIITPSVGYSYVHDPTVPSSTLDQFDAVDALGRGHGLTFTLENKLQTKRKSKTYDLLRSSIETDFALKESTAPGSFNDIRSEIEFNPLEWLSFSSDSLYNAHEDRLKETNFDLYITKGKYYGSIGKRWTVDADDQLTTEFGYTMNHKWKFRVYNRMDVRSGELKEYDLSARRDMHEWWMDLNFNHRLGEGDEILVVFTLKAFPDIAIDAGTSFNRRKAGSSSNSQ